MSQGLESIILWGGKYCSTHQTLPEEEDAFCCLICGCPRPDASDLLGLTHDDCMSFQLPESSCFRKEEIWSWQAGRLVNSWEHVGGVFKCTFLQTQGISRLSYLWARIFSNIALLATSYQNGLKYRVSSWACINPPHIKKKTKHCPPKQSTNSLSWTALNLA